MQKNNVIQYPRLIKLIIVDLMEKYDSISKRLKEDYHTIKDDTTLNVSAVEKKILEEGVEKLVEGEEESNGSDFADMGIKEKVNEALKDIVLKIATTATNDLINENLPRIVANVVNKKREFSKVVVPPLISQEFVAHAPKIIEELFRIYMQNTVLNVHPTTKLWDVLKAKFEKSSASVGSYMYDAFRKRNYDDHQGDNAPREGEKNVKSQKLSKISNSARSSSSKQPTKETNTSASEQQPQQQDSDPWVNILVIDEDEAIQEEETPELINEFQNVDKRVSTIFDHERIEVIIKDLLSNQYRDAMDYSYHLKQAQNYMENQVVWESMRKDLKRPQPEALVFYGPQRNPNEPPRYLYNKDLFFLKNGNIEEEKYVISLHKIHATSFPEEDREEKMIRWVRKVFKTFNEETRLSIKHWKDSWHKRIYKIKHREV
nr:hypothetical protein [Tanacetum cinerariifolium]